MPNYDNGKIYKLWIHETDDIYIGSTIQNLSQRLSQHKKDYNKNVGFCSSKILFELSDNVMIELIEEYKCDNKNQLERKEGEHIRNNKCVNKYIAGRTQQDYILENRNKILEYQQNYYNGNKVELLKKSKLYREQNKDKINEKALEKVKCECGCEVIKRHLLRHKRSQKHFNLMLNK